MSFEWIEGEPITEVDAEKAFYFLGKMHLIGKKGKYDNGFNTICHGDFHLKNILRTNNKMKFVDVTYMHFGWNYMDFDYVDFYGLYDPVVYPWMMRSKDYMRVYHEALGIKLTSKEQETIIKRIVKYSIENNIINGLKNGIDVSREQNLLQKYFT